MFLTKVIKKRRKVGPVRTKKAIVANVCGLLHRRTGTSIVEVINAPASKVLSHPERCALLGLLTNGRLASSSLERLNVGSFRVASFVPEIDALFGRKKIVVLRRREAQ